MRFLLFAITTFLFINERVCAQVVLINIKVGECAKCQLPVEALNPTSTGIPTYIVFPESYYDQKEELNDLYHFRTRGYVPVFNDSLKKYFTLNSVSQVVLLAGNEVLYRSTVLKM